MTRRTALAIPAVIPALAGCGTAKADQGAEVTKTSVAVAIKPLPEKIVTYFRSTKPEIVAVRSTRGMKAVMYRAPGAKGTPEVLSTTFRRIASRLQIVYDPFLDDAIRDYIQTATQTAVDPTAQTPAKQALRAAFNATRLQSQYLDQLLDGIDR